MTSGDLGGRPMLERPWNFPLYVDATLSGKMSVTSCSKALGVSVPTFRRWRDVYAAYPEDERTRMLEEARTEYYRRREEQKQFEENLDARKKEQLQIVLRLHEQLGLSLRGWRFSDMTVDQLDAEITRLEDAKLTREAEMPRVQFEMLCDLISESKLKFIRGNYTEFTVEELDLEIEKLEKAKSLLQQKE